MIESRELPEVNERVEKIMPFINEYKYKDLMMAIYCINICVNNRSALSSQMTLNMSLFKHSRKGKKEIKTYEQFVDFFNSIEKELQIDVMDDYIVEDFGEIKIDYKNNFYNMIIGTGHNMVFAEMYCLNALGTITEDEDKIEEVIKYNSEIIDYFKEYNINDGEEKLRFKIPSERLFYRTIDFFKNQIIKYDLQNISKIVDMGDNTPIEKKHFIKYYKKTYPLYNTSILIDLIDKYYQNMNAKDKVELADLSIFKVLNDICILDQGINPNTLFPVTLVNNGRIISKHKYAFVLKCEKGTIIAINKDEFKDETEINKEINKILNYKNEDKLNIGEIIKRQGENQYVGIKVLKECNIKFIVYDSFINVCEYRTTTKSFNNSYYECSALDLIYMLLFMEGPEELYEYVEKDVNEGIQQMVSFGGDSSKFLLWKSSNHKIIQGAINISFLNIEHTLDTEYVLKYYKEKLKHYPFECKCKWLFKNPFIWNIENGDYGYLHFMYKLNNSFGGKLRKMPNGATLFLIHNVDYYNQEEITEMFARKVYLIDEINMRKFNCIEKIIGTSKKLKNKMIEIMYMPSKYAEQVGIKICNDNKYVNSDSFDSNESLNIRYCMNYEKLQEDIAEARDRTIENMYLKELLKPLKLNYMDEYEKIINDLNKSNSKAKEIGVTSMKIDYIYNDSMLKYSVDDDDYIEARQKIAMICKEENIEHGDYHGKAANETIRKMQKTLIEAFEKEIKKYNRIDIHEELLEIYANTITYVNSQKYKFSAFEDIDDNVREDFQNKVIEDREKERHHIRAILYLIETNLYIERDTQKIITHDELNKLLAFSNWLVVLGENADICYFTENESFIRINYDYTIDVLSENDNENEEIISAEQYQKRVYKWNNYSIKGDEEDKIYLEKVTLAFEKDTSIKIRDLTDVYNFFKIYAIEDNLCKKCSENVYIIDKKDIVEKINESIYKRYFEKDDEKALINVLNFITIKTNQLKTIKGKESYYLPVGNRKERDNRIEIKPLLCENEQIYFSPAIVSNAMAQWINGLTDFFPPYEIGLTETMKILNEWKKKYEKEMVNDIKKIFDDNNFSYVRTNVELFKIDKISNHPRDLGDYDVIAIDDSKLKIWIIESKVLKKVGSFFEMYFQQKKFFEEHKDDEDFQRRIDYMKLNYKKILKALNFDTSANYEVIPYMVVNKVMMARYKKIDFPIISIGELDYIIKKKYTC